MLEIRRGSAARSYENTFFREFAKNLLILFDKYSIDGLLIANSECETSPNLRIDSLLITENAICLIDFKNIGGDVVLPQADEDFSEGQWVTQSGVRIKGGSLINPYKQLTWQKKALTWVFHNSSIKSNICNNEKLDPSHANKIVCFQKPIQLKGGIPGRNEIDFFITDSERYLETIKDILDVEDAKVKLTKKSFDAFKEVFLAEPFLPTEEYKKQEAIEITSPALNYDGLYPDQKSALHEITEFIRSDTDKIFILQGTSLSGKSHLSPFIEDVGFNNKIPQIEFFASSSRVASNLLSESNIKYNSIYSYIYGGGLQDDQEGQDNDEIGNEDENADNIKLEMVPLKKSENEDKALFIVDEAQLVADSYYQSIDLRFGSGKLLQDLIKFCDLNNSSRKIIFIGDSFQISMDKKGESALNPVYFKEKYNLATKAFQLIDKDDVSPIVKQALVPVNGIRRQTYNQMAFEFSGNFKKVTSDDVLGVVSEKIKNNTDFHLLSLSNADTQKINLWIKKSILNNGEDLEKRDLVIINNNLKIEDRSDPFSEGQKIFNGQFGTVINVDKAIISEVVTPKGKQPVEIMFRKVTLALNDTENHANVLSLENYRLSEKGELSEDEIIALKIILNREVIEHSGKNPFEESVIRKQLVQSKQYNELEAEIADLNNRLENGERVKTRLLKEKRTEINKLERDAKRKHRKNIERELFKDSSSKYFKYKNSAYLRFGWALTVHKSTSYKWDEVLFNVDHGENGARTNEGYFKWIYTGLTRAKENIELINYRPITPLQKIQFKDNSTDLQEDKKIYFVADTDAKVDSFSNSMVKKFNFADDKPASILLQLYQFVSNKLEHKGIKIRSINHPNYQEIYELEGDNNQACKVSFYYNQKGRVRIPTLMQAVPKQFGVEVIETLLGDHGIVDLSFIGDVWRRKVYTDIYASLKDNDYQISHIIQTAYQDTIKISQGDSGLVVGMYYDGDGFFSSIICTYRSCDEIWSKFKSILNDLREQNAITL